MVLWCDRYILSSLPEYKIFILQCVVRVWILDFFILYYKLIHSLMPQTLASMTMSRQVAQSVPTKIRDCVRDPLITMRMGKPHN